MGEEEQPKSASTDTAQTGSRTNRVTEKSDDNPITRIPPDIEQRVGAPKNYADMSAQELQAEHSRLSIAQDTEGFWDRRLAKDKLVGAIVERRERDKDLLRARLDLKAVPEGYVRVYRGEDEEGLGQYSTTEPVAGRSGKWFSTNLDKAAAFAGNKGENGRVRYMDITQPEFEAWNKLSRTNKTDIQVPVGYDIQAGSKVLMLDGSIPLEVLEKKDDNPLPQKGSAHLDKQAPIVAPSDKPPMSPTLSPVKESLLSKAARLFSSFRPKK